MLVIASPFIHSYSSLLYWTVPNESMIMYSQEVSDVVLNTFDKGAQKNQKKSLKIAGLGLGGVFGVFFCSGCFWVFLFGWGFFWVFFLRQKGFSISSKDVFYS